jgi:hypothetical protein
MKAEGAKFRRGEPVAIVARFAAGGRRGRIVKVASGPSYLVAVEGGRRAWYAEPELARLGEAA